MSFQEKDFQTLFNRWARHCFKKTAVFELKITKGNSVPFSDLKEHQENALYCAKNGNIIYKIPDDSIAQKPFDAFSMNKVPAFVVLMFHAKQSEFIMVDIDVWIKEKETSERKSLTEERAKEIGAIKNLRGNKSN